jgi:hypothetical protein
VSAPQSYKYSPSPNACYIRCPSHPPWFYQLPKEKVAHLLLIP